MKRNHASVHTRQILLTMLTGCAVFLGCAEIRSPEGGPPDKTPPTLVSSFPESGATAVTGEPKIKIRFSEAVQAGTGTQVFISPRASRKPKVKWRGEEMIIMLPDTLIPNQTYVIQVGAATADLRGNKLDSAVIIAFSTGTMLDSGFIAGRVTQNGAAAGNIVVALYAISNDQDSLSFDSLNADYMTVTNQKGAFEFRYLPDRMFRLVAFSDKNRNEWFNPLTEPFGLPDRPIRIGDSLDLTNLALEISSVDTAKPQLSSALFTQNKTVKVRITKEIPLAYVKLHPEATVLADSTSHEIRSRMTSFAESEDSASSNLTLYFGEIVEGVYELQIPYDSLIAPLSARVVVKSATDKESPSLSSWAPGDKPMFVSAFKIGLTFSEPIDSTSAGMNSLLLIENDRDTVALSSRWHDPFHLNVTPDKLKPGANYRLDVFGAGITDRAGNQMEDSIKSLRFSSLSEDSLGTIAGTLKVTVPGRESDPVMLILQDAKRKAIYRWRVASREFRYELPAGKYLLSGFVDSDNDGARNTGRISPFSPSESTATYSDTISVRARFETTGIELEFK